MINMKIWEKKYKAPEDKTPEDTFRRVAKFAAETPQEEADFYSELSSLRFIPGGRILAVGGTGKEKGTMSNCFALADPPDDMKGIMDALSEGALTMQAGGGIGMNFSKIRPYGTPVKGTGSIASGPIDFMKMWNAMSSTISGVGDRKGAMIAVLNVSHPDIEAFIAAKAENSAEKPVLEKFNISIGITDDFMEAVKKDSPWNLVFGEKIHKTVSAKELWFSIIENNHKKAEPGMLFLDTVKKMNNLYYCEEITACNPCGELPLPANGSCNLGALNLPQFVTNPFEGGISSINFKLLKKSIGISVRMLDNILDKNYYPLKEQVEETKNKRRIGLGIMGLGSALAMLRLKYGSPDAILMVERVMSFIAHEAYKASIEIAKKKGAFPLFDAKKYLEGGFIKTLPEEIRKSIKRYGIRNSHILTIAPTGSTAQLVGNVSGGLEPIFSVEFKRRNYDKVTVVRDYAYSFYCEKFGEPEKVPDFFVEAHNLTPDEHIKMQAAAQEWIDSSISKTINLKKETTVEEMSSIYISAWENGLKGCTTYREGSLENEILSKTTEPAAVVQQQISQVKRAYKLRGETFKVKIPEQKHAYYITFNHKVMEDGKKKPYEFFINTKDVVSEEWVTLLTRITSAVFRNVENPTFLVDEFRDIRSMQTGFWSGERKKFVPSLAAEFGEVMKDYFEGIGLLESEVPVELYEKEANGVTKGESKLAYCKNCGQYAGVFESGCFHCQACDYSKC